MEVPLPVVFFKRQLIYSVGFCVLAYLLISSWPQILGSVSILSGNGEASLICSMNRKSEINSPLVYFLFTVEPKLDQLYFTDTLMRLRAEERMNFVQESPSSEFLKLGTIDSGAGWFFVVRGCPLLCPW